jgi:hypothetical protein
VNIGSMLSIFGSSVAASYAVGGGKDEACANAGLAKTGDRLN